MTNDHRPQKSNSIDPEELKVFMEIQKQKVANEAKDLSLKEKNIEFQAQYAHRLLEHQAKIETDRPKENRKTMTRIAYIVGFLMIVVMVFSGICLYLNKEEFLYMLAKSASYVLTTLGGYYFGRKSKSGMINTDNNLSPSVEEIKD